MKNFYQLIPNPCPSHTNSQATIIAEFLSCDITDERAGRVAVPPGAGASPAPGGGPRRRQEGGGFGADVGRRLLRAGGHEQLRGDANLLVHRRARRRRLPEATTLGGHHVQHPETGPRERGDAGRCCEDGIVGGRTAAFLPPPSRPSLLDLQVPALPTAVRAASDAAFLGPRVTGQQEDAAAPLPGPHGSHGHRAGARP